MSLSDLSRLGCALLATALTAAVLSPVASAEDAKPAKAKVLMLTQSKGFTHGSVRRPDKEKLAASEVAMIQLGQQTGLFDVTCTQDAEADFTKENLAKYDVVMLYTTGPMNNADKSKNLPIPHDAFEYLLKEWLPQKGHGFIGFHSATDTGADYEPYWDLIGGSFNGHPWGSGSTVSITVHDPDHPGVKAFGAEFEIKDEIYQYSHWQPEKVRVLASLNMAKTSLKKPYHVPVIWVKEVGQGKMYYSNLGHNETTWTNKAFLDSVTGAMKWIRGIESGSAKPNPELSKAWDEKSKEEGAEQEAARKKKSESEQKK